MNELINKFLLVIDKLMPEMHCETFTNNKERIQQLKETGDSRYIYQNELDKACFNMTWFMEILTLKRRSGQFHHSCGFSENVSSNKTVKH